MKDWGFNGEVIYLGIDHDEYGNYHGSIEKVLRVGNGLTSNSMKFIKENLIREIPYTIIGDSPEIQEAVLPSKREEYKGYLQSHRLYLSMLNDKDDDGYNLAMLEAMATGMPVVS
jgi:glycosyltransferase involved in cell wall biosynthesis